MDLKSVIGIEFISYHDEQANLLILSKRDIAQEYFPDLLHRRGNPFSSPCLCCAIERIELDRWGPVGSQVALGLSSSDIASQGVTR